MGLENEVEEAGLIAWMVLRNTESAAVDLARGGVLLLQQLLQGSCNLGGHKDSAQRSSRQIFNKSLSSEDLEFCLRGSACMQVNTLQVRSVALNVVYQIIQAHLLCYFVIVCNHMSF
jgi:hypothetical protein